MEGLLAEAGWHLRMPDFDRGHVMWPGPVEGGE